MRVPQKFFDLKMKIFEIEKEIMSIKCCFNCSNFENEYCKKYNMSIPEEALQMQDHCSDFAYKDVPF